MSIIIASEKIKLFSYLSEMCEYVRYTEEWRDAFWNKLLENEAVYQEYIYYAEHKDFLLDTKVNGYSVIDILVWEMRKYNVRMDRGKNGEDCDKEAMVLEAFNTMLDMCNKTANVEWSMEMRNGMDQL